MELDTTKSLVSRNSSNSRQSKDHQSVSQTELQWPIYILHGNGSIFVTSLAIDQKTSPEIKGPLPAYNEHDMVFGKNYCSVLCISSTPPILCISHCNGTISHSIVLPLDEPTKNTVDRDSKFTYYGADRALFTFETVEVELGLSMDDQSSEEYMCPILLHRDLSRVGSYYATHDTGVHSINIPCVDDLHTFLSSDGLDDSMVDILQQQSSADYLICTKTANSQSLNPVIGFSVYYDPMSILTLLANNQLVTLPVVSLPLLPSAEEIQKEHLEPMTSPMKQMLSNPFDAHIQNILKKIGSQPILKLSSSAECSQQDKFSMLQRAAQVFKEQYFKQLETARLEIEKRIKALKMLKTYQANELEKMKQEKNILQEKAGNLAEKYEDIKDKQEELTKKLERVLVMLSRKQTEPSNAEKKFIQELKNAEDKVGKFKKALTALKNKHKYNEVQMENWNSQNKKESMIDDVQSKTLNANLGDMTVKISNLMKEVNEYKSQLSVS